MVTIRLTQTTLDAQRLEDGLRSIWGETLADPDVRQWLKEQGEEPDALAGAKIEVEGPVDVGPSDWFGDALVKIGVAVISGALLKLFEEFIMPKLKERFGAESIGTVIADDECSPC